ncbi:MAG: chorion class high-cysteine HCB protein 13 [Clostridiales bacterium]|nr:chorion class high-cysteine HCB protein 13 [Clostridiales bacterium]
MNFFNNLFGGKGDMKGDNDCCCIIWLLLLLSSCGGGCFNFGDICNCEIIKLLVLLMLISSFCGGHDGCGVRC